MVTTDEIRGLAGTVRQLASQAAACEAIALALQETGGKVYHTFPFRSEHERARDSLLAAAKTSLKAVKAMRRTTLSADLIRADADLVDLIDCCKKCFGANYGRVAGGEPFRCVVRERAESNKSGALRYRLSVEGNILEQH